MPSSFESKNPLTCSSWMIASRYQNSSGVSAMTVALSGCSRSDLAARVSTLVAALFEIVEVRFALAAAAHAEDVGGYALRIELDVIARAVPQIACVGDEIVHLERRM